MLVARRDPPFESGDYDYLHGPTHAAPRSSRFILVFQLIGSLLAIPVGLASAYSVYQSNFSAEAKCNSLRANIIGVLDRNGDASTLRALARRDVVAFETSCASVDPDAVAAFKSLLTAKIAPPPAAVVAPQPAAYEPVKQVEAPKAPAVKAAAPAAAAKTVHHDAAAGDANWIASVRRALEHNKQPVRAEAGELPATTWTRPLVQPAPQPLDIQEQPGLPPPAAAVAPTLPPASPVAAMPEPAPVVADHPVPPESIPEPVPSAMQHDRRAHAGIRGWIANIPLVNSLVGR